MKIAISTGGGDAPGINAVIRAAVLSATGRGWDVVGVRDGWNGLLLPERYSAERPGVIPLTRDSVRGVTHLGGTILGTTNRGSPMKFPVAQADGSVRETDRSAELVDMCKRTGFDAVIMVGGDGTMAI